MSRGTATAVPVLLVPTGGSDSGGGGPRGGSGKFNPTTRGSGGGGCLACAGVPRGAGRPYGIGGAFIGGAFIGSASAFGSTVGTYEILLKSTLHSVSATAATGGEALANKLSLAAPSSLGPLGPAGRGVQSKPPWVSIGCSATG